MTKLKSIFCVVVIFVCFSQKTMAQVDGNQLGNWYMYFWDTSFKESGFGMQGDVQYRNWNFIGDLEQLLLRAGFTYKPKNANIKFTLGYGHITTGAFGDSDDTTTESRIYQEVLIPHKISGRFYAKHRFRYEQRFVEGQDFRTRYRYNIFLNVPLNKKDLGKNSFYLALYNELFINAQRNIGDGRTVQIFDRNRFYSGFGYSITDKLKVQLGHMLQSTNSVDKPQLQMSLHHSF
ncbi:MAG: DUF2490 domain-containing protein [Flavobacteriaceae bacterium]|nr:DUF2490 domain-containing protein [Flavobacteriaceae bacterium]